MNIMDFGIGFLSGCVITFLFSLRNWKKKKQKMIEKSKIEPIYYDLGKLLK